MGPWVAAPSSICWPPSCLHRGGPSPAGRGRRPRCSSTAATRTTGAAPPLPLPWSRSPPACARSPLGRAQPWRPAGAYPPTRASRVCEVLPGRHKEGSREKARGCVTAGGGRHPPLAAPNYGLFLLRTAAAAARTSGSGLRMRWESGGSGDED
jgi:hypothetical protein